MSEAQPNRRVGGHAYGRRSGNLSNTAEEGELCIYTGHSIGRFSGHSMRFDSHQACVRCVAAAREGRMSFDIDRLLKRERRRALKFWSQVDIGAPDECWMWNGCINKRTKQPQFAWRRHGKLRLLSTFVDAAIPHPAFIRSTDVYLTPELERSSSFSFKKPIDIKRESTFTSSSNTSNTSLVTIKAHRMTRESTQRVTGVDTKFAFLCCV